MPRLRPQLAPPPESRQHQTEQANVTSDLFLGNTNTRPWMTEAAKASPAVTLPAKHKSPVKLKAKINKPSGSISNNPTSVTHGDWSSSTDEEDCTHFPQPAACPTANTTDHEDILHSPTPVETDRVQCARGQPSGMSVNTCTATSQETISIPTCTDIAMTIQPSVVDVQPIPRTSAAARNPTAGSPTDAPVVTEPPQAPPQSSHPPQPPPDSDMHIAPQTVRTSPNLETFLLTPVEKLRDIETHVQSHGKTALDSMRLTFLNHSAVTYDMDALLMHQIHMISSHHPDWLSNRLGFGPEQLAGMPLLSYVLGNNAQLTPALSLALLDYPDPCDRLLHGDLRPTVNRMGISLKLLNTRWPAAQHTYHTRQFPLSPKEVHRAFALPSPGLQKVVFMALNQSVQAFRSNQHAMDVQARFIEMQDSQIYLDYDAEIETWRQRCVAASGQATVSPMAQNASQQRMAHSQTPNGVNPGFQRGAQQMVRPSELSPTSNFSVQQYRLPSQMPFGPSNQPFTDPASLIAGSQMSPRPHPKRGTSSSRKGWNVALSTSSQSGDNSTRAPRYPMQAPRDNSQQQNGSHPLLPPKGFYMAIAVAPHIDRVALHQADLRDPIAHVVDADGKVAPNLRLYQVVRRLVTKPQLLTMAKRYSELVFEVAEAELGKKIQQHPPKHSLLAQDHQLFKEGSLRWRLRCVARKPTSDSIEDADFCASATAWPEHLLVTFNNEILVELRRKQHYGKCLPAELTQFILVGTNTLAISYDEVPKEARGKQFWVAVELVEVVEHQDLRQSIPHLPRETAVDRIMSIMKADIGDEVAIINPFISIDLTDPFSATIWKVPVRSRHCKHRECFDLDTFLDTRPRLQQDGPHSGDDWKCPICQKDARPMSLVIDGFLESVRKSLDAQGKLDVAKTIFVQENGDWEAKEEQHNEQRESAAAASSACKNTGLLDQRESRNERSTLTSTAAVEAIVLDDDGDD